MQQHGHMVREDILADKRNHGPVGDAARRLIVLQLDYEEFPTIRWGVIVLRHLMQISRV